MAPNEGDAANTICGLQCSCSGWPTGNGNKLINSQACCLAQLCLGALSFFPYPVGHPETGPLKIGRSFAPRYNAVN